MQLAATPVPPLPPSLSPSLPPLPHSLETEEQRTGRVQHHRQQAVAEHTHDAARRHPSRAHQVEQGVHRQTAHNPDAVDVTEVQLAGLNSAAQSGRRSGPTKRHTNQQCLSTAVGRSVTQITNVVSQPLDEASDKSPINYLFTLDHTGKLKIYTKIVLKCLRTYH